MNRTGTTQCRAAGIEAKGLKKAFRTGGLLARRSASVQAVDDVSLAVAPGQGLAVVGASGSGKTTVARMLTLLERPDYGEVLVDGEVARAGSGTGNRDFRRRVQIVFQNPYESLDPRVRVRNAIAEPLKRLDLASGARRRDKVLEALEMVGLQPAERFLDAYPANLSGGQRQRVAIARAIVVQPSVLVADEPVSMLDASVRAGILELFTRFRRQLGIALVFISHDLASARHVSDNIIVMRQGRVVEAGDTDVTIAAPKHDYTKLLLAASLGDDETEGR